MTIEDKIDKLKSEIDVAKSALKGNVNELDYTKMILNVGENLIGSVNGAVKPNSILSYLPSQLNKKYGYIISIMKGIFKILK